MTQPVQEPTPGRTDSGLEWRTRQLFRRPSSSGTGPGEWQEVGGTDPDSVPWENDWAAAGTPYAGVFFRTGAFGGVDFKGHADGQAATSTVMFTLPAAYWPDADQTWARDMIMFDGGFAVVRLRVTQAGVVGINVEVRPYGDDADPLMVWDGTTPYDVHIRTAASIVADI